MSLTLVVSVTFLIKKAFPFKSSVIFQDFYLYFTWILSCFPTTFMKNMYCFFVNLNLGMIYYKWISKALGKAIICVSSSFSKKDTSQFVNIDQGLPVCDSKNSLNLTRKNSNQDFSKTVLQNIFKICTIAVLI